MGCDYYLVTYLFIKYNDSIESIELRRNKMYFLGWDSEDEIFEYDQKVLSLFENGKWINDRYIKYEKYIDKDKHLISVEKHEVKEN